MGSGKAERNAFGSRGSEYGSARREGGGRDGVANDADWVRILSQAGVGAKHPERYILGKAHPDRARQFKPFAALRGYEELIDEVIARADTPHDFSSLDEGC